LIAPGVAICTFAPRPLENGDPRALKVPFYHSNIDFDEVLFYHAGEFFSRDGIRPGMLTFHPQGIHHGPQTRAFERTGAATRTEEVAVMIDTRRPLEVCAPVTALRAPRLLAELAALSSRGLVAQPPSSGPGPRRASPQDARLPTRRPLLDRRLTAPTARFNRPDEDLR
jgi:hypothetical protein